MEELLSVKKTHIRRLGRKCAAEADERRPFTAERRKTILINESPVCGEWEDLSRVAAEDSCSDGKDEQATCKIA